MNFKTEIDNAVGLWIDHRKAIIVTLSREGDRTEEILSHVETHPGRLANVDKTKSYEDRQPRSDEHQLSEFNSHIGKYYDQVIKAIGNAEAILIIGPGEAKGEFKKRVEHARQGARIVGIKVADKMNNMQIAAKVRDFFNT